MKGQKQEQKQGRDRWKRKRQGDRENTEREWKGESICWTCGGCGHPPRGILQIVENVTTLLAWWTDMNFTPECISKEDLHPEDSSSPHGDISFLLGAGDGCPTTGHLCQKLLWKEDTQ
eukprot:6461423-Amphidinium_carterae.3